MNIWTGLLFLEGSVADVRLARELSGDERAEALPGIAAAKADLTPKAALNETAAREYAR